MRGVRVPSLPCTCHCLPAPTCACRDCPGLLAPPDDCPGLLAPPDECPSLLAPPDDCPSLLAPARDCLRPLGTACARPRRPGCLSRPGPARSIPGGKGGAAPAPGDRTHHGFSGQFKRPQDPPEPPRTARNSRDDPAPIGGIRSSRRPREGPAGHLPLVAVQAPGQGDDDHHRAGHEPEQEAPPVHAIACGLADSSSAVE